MAGQVNILGIQIGLTKWYNKLDYEIFLDVFLKIH
jgi:hypothetical protein